ncbi:MAG TPA: radical SAM protein [Candidatus Nanoarchaeia archaeon]|nr:radical SAM protein [Candidatus Nanoarchaeia archaeon]
MKILLIYPNIIESPKDISHGLAQLSSILKKEDHEVQLIDYTFKPTKKEIINKVKNFNPDIIGVTIATNDKENALNILRLIKPYTNAKIMGGGFHATIAPEDLIKEEIINGVCLGEGEQAFLEFVNNLQHKKKISNIKNLWYKTPQGLVKNEIRKLIQDLDLLPFPDKSLFYYQKYIDHNRGLATFITSRGCPYQCSYCINKTLQNIYKGEKYTRFHSIDYLIKEIKEVITKYKVKEIEFYDDTFTLDKERIKEFVDVYPKEIGLPFYINARVNAVTKEDFLLLKKAGCVRVSIGIESGDEKIRNEVLNRNMSNEQIIETFRWAKEAKLKTYSFNMIGMPFETINSIKKTIKINQIIQPDFIGVSLFNAFKGTEIYNLCEKNNLIKNKTAKSYFRESNVKSISEKKLQKIRESFGFHVYKYKRPFRATIDLIDKKFSKYPEIQKIKESLLKYGIRKFI